MLYNDPEKAENKQLEESLANLACLKQAYEAKT